MLFLFELGRPSEDARVRSSLSGDNAYQDDAYQPRTVDPWDEIHDMVPPPVTSVARPPPRTLPAPAPDYITTSQIISIC